MNLQPYLEFATSLAYNAGKITLRYFNTGVQPELKENNDPVTIADREAEVFIRSEIERVYPTHSIVGEEYGENGKNGSSFRWIIDPIDGTKNFLRGVPVWGTLIAFCVDDVPMAGTASAPSLHRRWMGLKNGGAYLNGEQIYVSKTSKLEDIQASYGDVTGFAQAGYSDSLTNINKYIWRARGMGDFWSHMLVAEGAIDLGLDTKVQPYDVASSKLIVEEAGGQTSSFEGIDSFREPTFVSTNGQFHNEIIEIILSGRG